MVLMVREIKEIRRAMTVEEMCMWYASRECDYTDSFRNIARKTLDDTGFYNIDHRYDEVKDGIGYLGASFKQVTERPATHAELTAYYLLKCIGKEMCCVDSHEECAACPFYDIEFECSEVRDKCLEIIKDKEFYEKED